MVSPFSMASPYKVVAFSVAATVVVSGATGGVGLHLMRWLADQGARHLALLARSEPGEEAERVIAGLREQGIQVSFFQGDVADDAELRRCR